MNLNTSPIQTYKLGWSIDEAKCNKDTRTKITDAVVDFFQEFTKFEQSNIGTYIEDIKKGEFKEDRDLVNIQKIVKQDSELAIGLCDATLRAMTVAKNLKTSNEQSRNHLKIAMAKTLKDCPIEKLNTIINTDLYFEILNQKYQGEPLDLAAVKQIAMKLQDKEFKTKTKDSLSQNFQNALIAMDPEQFVEAMKELKDKVNTNVYDEIIKQKIIKTHLLNDKLLVAKISPADFNKYLILIADGFSSDSVADWKKMAGMLSDVPVDKKISFVDKYLNNTEKSELNLKRYFEIYLAAGLKAGDLNKILPSLIKAFPEATTEEFLQVQIVNGALKGEHKIEIARSLALKDPENLEMLVKNFTLKEKLLVILDLLAHSTDLEAILDNEYVADILDEKNMGKEERDILFDCCKVIAVKNASLLPDFLVSNLNLSPLMNQPRFVAFQKESGSADPFAFYDVSDDWETKDAKEYYDTLLRSLSDPELCLGRLDSILSFSDKDKIDFLLENIDVIELDVLCQKAHELKLKGEKPSSSAVREGLKELNLSALKENKEKEHENVKRAIEKTLDEFPELQGLFKDFCKKLTSSKNNPLEITRELIAFANFADKVKNLYSTYPERKEEIDNYLKANQATINEMLTVSKPNTAIFFLTSRFIEQAISNDFKISQTKSKSAATAYVSVEKVINMQLEAIYPELSKGLLAFGTGNTISKQKNYYSQILETLELIKNDPVMSHGDKKYLIDFILGREPIALKHDLGSIAANLNAVSIIINLKGSSLLGKENLVLTQEKDSTAVLKELASQSFSNLIGGKISKDDAALLMAKLNQTRDPSLLMSYLGRLNNLPKEKREQNMETLAVAANDFAKGNFTTERYAKSPHLQKMKQLGKFDVSKWATVSLKKDVKIEDLVIDQKEKEALKKYDIQVSDDFIDLLAMGTDVMGSCLSIKTGALSDIKDLLGNVVDGKTKLVTVKKEGDDSLKGRVALKLLWDEIDRTPVILMEGVYTNLPSDSPESQAIEEALSTASKQLAQTLGLPLVSGAREGQTEGFYKHPISSLAPNLAPTEKCDPLANANKGVTEEMKKSQEEENQGLYILNHTNQIWLES
jgi:hypothetical protein